MDNRSMPEITIEDDLRPDYASPMDVPDYGQFLLQELLPHVEQAANVRLTEDPKRRICCGASSGGIGAFTCAWHFPGKFARVLCHVGAFTNIKGGHNYPWLIRMDTRWRTLGRCSPIRFVGYCDE